MGKEHNFSSLYHVTVDDAGRFSFPSKLMTQLVGDRIVYITRGRDRNCLWLMSGEYWQRFVARISSNSSPFDEDALAVVRYYVGHAFEQEIEEKNRRVAVPHALLELAGIRDKCTIVGMVKFFELWNPEVFREKMEREEEMRERRTSKLGGLVTF